jgi:hypothetical protein
MLVLAAIVAFTRPYDLTARWGALFLVLGSNATIYSGQHIFGWYHTILSLPRMIGWLIVLLPSFRDAFISPAGIAFAAVFPRRLFQRPWIWALVWLPAMITMPYYIFSDHLPIYSFARWWPDWYGSLVLK